MFGARLLQGLGHRGGRLARGPRQGAPPEEFFGEAGQRRPLAFQPFGLGRRPRRPFLRYRLLGPAEVGLGPSEIVDGLLGFLGPLEFEALDESLEVAVGHGLDRRGGGPVALRDHLEPLDLLEAGPVDLVLVGHAADEVESSLLRGERRREGVRKVYRCLRHD